MANSLGGGIADSILSSGSGRSSGDIGGLLDVLSKGAGLFGGLKTNDAVAQAMDDAYKYNVAGQQGTLNEVTTNNALLRALSEKLQAEGKLGNTDTRGNTMKYVDGVGWVQTAAPRTANLQNASDQEEMQRLLADNAVRRRGEYADEQQRGREGQQAQSTLAQLQQPNQVSREAILGALMNAKGRGVNEAYDKTSHDVSLQSTRAGSNAVPVLTELAHNRAKDLGDAYNDATVESYNTADSLNNNRNSSLGNLYSLFAGRASGYKDNGFSPSSGGFAADANTNAVQNAANLYSQTKAPPTFTPLQPNMSAAQSAQGEGQAASGLFGLAKKAVPIISSFF